MTAFTEVPLTSRSALLSTLWLSGKFIIIAPAAFTEVLLGAFSPECLAFGFVVIYSKGETPGHSCLFLGRKFTQLPLCSTYLSP